MLLDVFTNCFSFIAKHVMLRTCSFFNVGADQMYYNRPLGIPTCCYQTRQGLISIGSRMSELLVRVASSGCCCILRSFLFVKMDLTGPSTSKCFIPSGGEERRGGRGEN